MCVFFVKAAVDADEHHGLDRVGVFIVERDAVAPAVGKLFVQRRVRRLGKKLCQLHALVVDGDALGIGGSRAVLFDAEGVILLAVNDLRAEDLGGIRLFVRRLRAACREG